MTKSLYHIPTEEEKQQRLKDIESFIEFIKKEWLKNPSLRFCQLLSSCTRIGTPIIKDDGFEGIKDCFYYEDEDIIEDFKKFNKITQPIKKA